MNQVEIAVWARVYIACLANRNHKGRINTPHMACLEATDAIRRLRTSVTSLEEEAAVDARRSEAAQAQIERYKKMGGKT